MAGRWNRIEPSLAEWIAAGNSPEAKPTAPYHAMFRDGDLCVFRAGRVKPACRRQRRRQPLLIASDEPHQEAPDRVHRPPRFMNLAQAKKSPSSAA